MRTLIVNANIVTGDGNTILDNRSIVIEGELIESIRTNPCPLADSASRIIDASGGLVIPGLIDSHDHGVTTGATGRIFRDVRHEDHLSLPDQGITNGPFSTEGQIKEPTCKLHRISIRALAIRLAVINTLAIPAVCSGIIEGGCLPRIDDRSDVVAQDPEDLCVKDPEISVTGGDIRITRHNRLLQ